MLYFADQGHSVIWVVLWHLSSFSKSAFYILYHNNAALKCFILQMNQKLMFLQTEVTHLYFDIHGTVSVISGFKLALIRRRLHVQMAHAVHAVRLSAD